MSRTNKKPTTNTRNRLKSLQGTKTAVKKKATPKKAAKTTKKTTKKPTKSTTKAKTTKTSKAKQPTKARNKPTTKKAPPKTTKSKGATKKVAKGGAKQPVNDVQAKNRQKSERLKEIGKKTQFKPGQSGNPKGRPKKVLTRFSQFGYTKQEVRDTFSALAGMTSKELDVIILDEESTVLEILAAREFKKSTKKKGGYSSSAKGMVEMFADKAVQHKVLEIDANVKHHSLADDELDAKINKLKAKIVKDEEVPTKRTTKKK